MKTAAVGLGLCLVLLGVAGLQGADVPASQTFPLWPGEVPGEAGAIGPEKAETKGGILRVSNVSVPTLTVFPPRPRARTPAPPS